MQKSVVLVAFWLGSRWSVADIAALRLAGCLFFRDSSVIRGAPCTVTARGDVIERVCKFESEGFTTI